MPSASRALGSSYELLEIIGSGSMGEVWRIWDRVEQGYRAAKVLRSEFTDDPKILARFLQEYAILANLRHAHIVEVHDLVVEGDRLALVMELVDGVSLREVLRSDKTLAPARAVEIAVAVLQALAAAHANGIIHRDVKPDNIMVGAELVRMPRVVKLADFGIARIAQDAAVSATGIVGTPAYLAPELLERGVTGSAGDIYALGTVLYEMLAGRTPFAGAGTTHTVAMRHLGLAPPRIEVPEALWELIAVMLSKNPENRPLAAEAAAGLSGVLPALHSLPTLAPCEDPGQWNSAAEEPPGTRLRAPELPPGSAAPASVCDVKLGDSRPMSIKVVVGTTVACLLVLVVLTSVVGRQLNERGRGRVLAAAFAQPKPWPIGLSYSSQATYLPREGIRLTVTLRYQYPITGEVLVVVPAVTADGHECASLDPSSWDSSVRVRALSGSFQASIQCGWALRSRHDDRATLVVNVLVPVVSRPSADRLTAWLAQIDDRTQAALDSYPAWSDPGFALQRITALRVVAQRRDVDVAYTVHATWAGLPPTTSALFSTSTGGTVVGPLAELFGLAGGADATAVPLSAVVQQEAPVVAQAARTFIVTEGAGLTTQAGPGIVAVDNDAGGTMVASVGSLMSAPVRVL